MATERANDKTIETCIREESERLGFELGGPSRDRLASYFALLERWGQRIRLSGSRRANELIQRHLADALYLHRALCGLETERRAERDLGQHNHADSYVDVGSGGGLPALPLLALDPRRRVSLVEARSRKATFLRSALHELGMSHCVVFDERLEQLAAQRAFEQPFTAAWSLATFAPPEWLRRAAPLVAAGGRVFVFVAGGEPAISSDGSDGSDGDGDGDGVEELELCDKQQWKLADGRPRQLLEYRRRRPT